MDRFELSICLLLWIITIALVIREQWRKGSLSVGLPFTYLFSLSLIHWFGALIYLFPWYSPQNLVLLSIGSSYETTTLGFLESLYGVIGFGIGCCFLAKPLLKLWRPTWINEQSRQPDRNLPRNILIIGLAFFVIIAPVLLKISGLAAIATSGVSLTVVGLCFLCWQAFVEGNKNLLNRYLLLTVCFPIVTIIFLGFASYGVAAATVVLLFVFSFYKPRWKSIIALLLGIMLGLTLFVNYIHARDQLRDSVWGGQNFGNRVETFVSVFMQTEPLDFSSQQQLEGIDARLNQNVLIGQAVLNLSEGSTSYAHGKTLLDAMLAPIPRIFWPNKPAFAGSGSIVSDYARLKFEKGVSVGIGQILEFYINFGSIGVFLGLMLFGLILRILDIVISLKLRSGNWLGAATWLLPALALIQPGGSIVEIVASLAAAIVFMKFMRLFLTRKRRHIPGAA
jgi:hypothetical protein